MASRLDARLRRLERERDRTDPATAWRSSEGLAALLAHAQAHPALPWDQDLDEDIPPTGLARLLAEARAYVAARARRLHEDGHT